MNITVIFKYKKSIPKRQMERIKPEEVRKEVWKKLDSTVEILEKISGRGNKEAYLYPICTSLIKDCYDKGLEEKEYESIKKEVCSFYIRKILL